MKPTPNKRVSSASQRKQQHLLDVTIRVGKERARRFRAVAGFICKTVLYGALAAGIWVGGREAWRTFVWENPEYFVRDPDVKTDGTLTREQILTAADIVDGRNILTVDLGKSRAALETRLLGVGFMRGGRVKVRRHGRTAPRSKCRRRRRPPAAG